MAISMAVNVTPFNLMPGLVIRDESAVGRERDVLNLVYRVERDCNEETVTVDLITNSPRQPKVTWVLDYNESRIELVGFNPIVIDYSGDYNPTQNDVDWDSVSF